MHGLGTALRYDAVFFKLFVAEPIVVVEIRLLAGCQVITGQVPQGNQISYRKHLCLCFF